MFELRDWFGRVEAFDVAQVDLVHIELFDHGV